MRDANQVVAAAVRDRKIAATDADRYRRLLREQPETYRRLLTASVQEGGLAAGIVPDRENQNYPPEWVPEVPRTATASAPAGRRTRVAFAEGATAQCHGNRTRKRSRVTQRRAERCRHPTLASRRVRLARRSRLYLPASPSRPSGRGARHDWRTHGRTQAGRALRLLPRARCPRLRRYARPPRRLARQRTGARCRQSARRCCRTRRGWTSRSEGGSPRRRRARPVADGMDRIARRLACEAFLHAVGRDPRPELLAVQSPLGPKATRRSSGRTRCSRGGTPSKASARRCARSGSHRGR
jgi:hypothetical protein